jgi:serine-type D-Ala-D-Ala carboxypeptidase/endopeptidase (penicillin-binding protein 4)
MTLQNFRITGKSVSFLIVLIVAKLITGQATGNAQQVSPSRAESICPAQLPSAIDAIANRPQFSRARWGLSIQTLNSAQTLYSREAQRYFIPASNTKLFTTAAALRQLGAGYRIRTSIYGSEEILRLVGRGDPSLKDAQLKELAQQLKRQGIRQVKQLIIEDGYFQGQALNPNWQWEDVHAYYGAPVNSLILNENAVGLTLSPQAIGEPLKAVWTDPLAALQWELENQSVTVANGEENSVEANGILGKPILQIRGQLTVDSKPATLSLSVRDPGKYFLQHLRLTLAAEGITVTQAMVSPQIGTENQPELAFVESPPLSQLIADTNQPSDNVYAEVLLRSLGVTRERNSPNSATTGLNVIKETLTELGVDPTSYALADGSGLSRQNLISPEALVQTLKAMGKLPQASIFRASLPIAGISGTLRNRFKNTSAQGIVQAKTGTMSGVTALSGYVDAPNYQPIVFSIIVNQSDQTSAPLRQAVDEMVVLLTRLKRC